MSSGTIPLFPLNVVVFPRVALPLHIFEERYKEMTGNAIRDDSEFGIVLVKENGISNAGCTVKVEKVTQMYEDGRMDILTRGRRRFEVMTLHEEHAWLEADVSFFDDEDLAAVPEALRTETMERYQALRAISSNEGRDEPDLADWQLSFQLAQVLPDLDLLNVLLRLRSEAERLKELNRYLAEYVPRQGAIERMRALAPTNGHGAKPSGL
ncbi:MAG TPA: LON peptidase substrate-binding domain-containing protein [Bryobacteraceae bacterium]|nr:LON peptidase substrate-binding domain-containing protein [Bryobacteraceae bacterium]